MELHLLREDLPPLPQHRHKCDHRVGQHCISPCRLDKDALSFSLGRIRPAGVILESVGCMVAQVKKWPCARAQRTLGSPSSRLSEQLA
jgi:hypothetical protein